VTVDSPTEAEITSALIKITRDVQPVVYFTTGHGERDLNDGGDTGFSITKAGLERDGFQVKTLMLVTTNTIPSDAGVVVLGGLHAPLQPSEVDTLRAYLTRGGRLMLMVDSSLDTQDRSLGDAGLGSLLNEWGITLNNDLVIDVVSSLQTDPRVLVAYEYGSSPITNKLGKIATAFPLARSMVLTQTAPPNVSLTALVKTSEQSWGAVDLETIVKAMNMGRLPGPTAQDSKGPLTIAAAASNSQTKARLVVFGTSYPATNQFSRWPGNFDLMLNSINWLAEQEAQITIRPKPFTTRELVPSHLMTIQVFGISVFLLPLAVLAVGAIVWWRRR